MQLSIRSQRIARLSALGIAASALVAARLADAACESECDGAMFFSSGFDENKRWFDIRRPEGVDEDQQCFRIWITDEGEGPCTETGNGETWQYREVSTGTRDCNPNGGVVAWATDAGTYMVIGELTNMQCWEHCEQMCP